MSNILSLTSLTSMKRPDATRERVVCIHSSASSGRQWRTLMSLMRDDLEILMPDLMGYGRDEAWSAGRPTSLEAEAERLVPLLSNADGGVHLLAHSYGGSVALELALRYTRYIRSITLYEPSRFGLLLGGVHAQTGGEQIVSIGRRVQLLVLSGRLHEAAQLFVEFWTGAGSWDALGVQQQEAVARRMTKVQADFEALFNDRTPAAAYGDLKMPVHLIGGSISPLPARQVIEALSTAIAHAVVTRVRGLGHMAPVTDPAAVALRLPRWLRRVETEMAA